MHRSSFWSLVCAAVALSSPVHVHAQPKDGAYFLQSCGALVQQSEGEKLSAQDAQSAQACSSFVTGFTDAISLTASTTLGRRSICFPEGGISDVQAAGVLVKYLRQNRQSLESAGRASFYVALVRAFPCK